MKFKYVFVLSILFVVVLISGCLNSNSQNQKTQLIAPTPAPTDKIINLHAQQIILDDNEIKELLGTDYMKINPKNQVIRNEPKSKGLQILSSIRVDIGNVTIGLFVSPSKDVSDKAYQSLVLDLQKNIKVIVNKIDIGNTTGELYSIVGSQNENTTAEPGTSYIIFNKNNIVVLVGSTPDIQVETLIKLAKRQEAKIVRILEVIQ